MPYWFLGKYRPYAIAFINQQICKRAISHRDYDIVHPTFVNPYYSSVLPEKPVVVTVHDLIQEKTNRADSEKTSKRRIRQLERADAIICVSEQTKDDLLDLYPRFKDKTIRVIYHGNNQEIPSDCGQRMFSFPYILYIGSREKYKNFSNFLQAFALLPKDLHLVCTGHAFSANELRDINRLKIIGRVHQQFVSDIQLMSLFHHAEAFIYPSTMEGFGLPILEAFRFGCPAIVSDIKCFREVGGTAVEYFNPLNYENIAETIRLVIYNPTMRDQYIRHGYNRLKKFSWNNTITQHADLYSRLI